MVKTLARLFVHRGPGRSLPREGKRPTPGQGPEVEGEGSDQMHLSDGQPACCGATHLLSRVCVLPPEMRKDSLAVSVKGSNCA